ncbi:class I SAM-dependent methyltransferase [Candidatus Mycobacterium methanotrophicum]|uniref:Class I SAM-dependent methyltransferase n=1 Tax=Candidatus Mycobacterium methanotrophicum TaxID=2943498 RepID=A0ABY4QPH6_9MYCO|nr:class I SAM-dependent methyltransferase [Candidatus Mycobacterium methanotrophicum]UQX11679.1 class I SAM-dependent methyltransferase [Candidatus Mycobacterium methanotrophicum]
MPPYRNVAEFNDQAASYDRGWRGRLRHEIAERTATLAVATVAAPSRVLDLGCGTGYLLRALADRYPDAEQLVGIDAAPAMVKTATALTCDDRLTFTVGVAEQIGCADDSFDLVVSTTSFDHWSDQQSGLRACVRVLRPGGRLVLVDQFSRMLLPTMPTSRRGKARTRQRATCLLRAGFCSLRWHRLHAVIINAVTATKPA